MIYATFAAQIIVILCQVAVLVYLSKIINELDRAVDILRRDG